MCLKPLPAYVEERPKLQLIPKLIEPVSMNGVRAWSWAVCTCNVSAALRVPAKETECDLARGECANGDCYGGGYRHGRLARRGLLLTQATECSGPRLEMRSAEDQMRTGNGRLDRRRRRQGALGVHRASVKRPWIA